MFGEPIVSATVFTEAMHKVNSGNWICRRPVMAFEDKLVGTGQDLEAGRDLNLLSK